MAIWLAAGDETGAWDIVDGRFCSENKNNSKPPAFNGLAWVIGNLNDWEKALTSPCGAMQALDAFSRPIAQRLPAGESLAESSDKYHLLDVWKTFRGHGRDIRLDEPQDEPALELVRRDAIWLLRDSGLGILAAGGNAEDARMSGLGVSNDGLRERARAFAALLVPVLPFLPSGDSLKLMAEGRTENAPPNAIQAAAGSQRQEEPYRDFLARLTEDARRQAERCQPFVADGSVIEDIEACGSKRLENFLTRKLPTGRFLQKQANTVIRAMKGIADLACTLAPRPAGLGFRLVVPEGFCNSLWAANYRELTHVIRH